eukprot:3777355-Pleurochrysis_carterae.AAC.2
MSTLRRSETGPSSSTFQLCASAASKVSVKGAITVVGVWREEVIHVTAEYQAQRDAVDLALRGRPRIA